MKRILSLLFLASALALPVVAQDDDQRVKLSASFTNTDRTDNTQGVQGAADFRLVGEKFRLYAEAHYVRPCIDCPKFKVFDTYSAGPLLSVCAFGCRVEPYGRAIFGVTTNYNGLNAFTRTYGGGVDVNAGFLFFRGGVDVKKVEGVAGRIESLHIGGGFRF